MVYKDIPGYGGLYQVTDTGQVWSVKSQKFLSPGTYKNGYEHVDLYTAGKRKDFLVHRLTALAFIPNPNNLPQVNHKNEIKADNRAANLEWCDSQYNNTYGTHKDINKKPIRQYTKDGKLVRTWKSATDAAESRVFGENKRVVQSGINRALSGRWGSYKNFIWKYSPIE